MPQKGGKESRDIRRIIRPPNLVASHNNHIILPCKTFVPFLRCKETAIEIARNESVSVFPCPLVRILKNRQLSVPLKIFPVQPFTPNQRHDDRIVKPGMFRLKMHHLVAHPLQYGLESVGLQYPSEVSLEVKCKNGNFHVSSELF